MNSKRIVQDGYDILAETYLRVRSNDREDVRLLAELAQRLPDGAKVLDAGCGAGVPVAQILSERCRVTGVDISAAQIALARELVPAAEFIQADMAGLDFPDGSFDAIVSYFAIIHVPREEHPAILANFHRMLAPGGLLLLSTGAGDNPDDTEDNWLDGGATMYWSHYGHADNLRLIAEADFDIILERLVTEDEEFGGGTHLFVLAQAR
ncbi:MAG TPA: methyltransferase domain-containing protein [Thermomicrobiales bacterium]|nr:methyltransferase domain-containing protein [Thermomicrobiales bacterium]